MKYFIFAILILLPIKNAFAYSYPRLAFTAGVSWASKYVIDGFTIGDSPVIEPSLTIEIPNTEFSFMAWSAIQLHKNESQNDEYDLFLFYNHDFFSDSSFAFNFHSFYDYWFYPNTLPVTDDFGDEISKFQKHGSKLHAGISFTNLLPLAGSFLIPSYNVFYWIYWAQNRSDLYQGGALHQLQLSYSHLLPTLIPGAANQYANITGNLNYNDGAFGVKPGLSHSTLALSYGFDALSSSFVLNGNKQWTYESSVNVKNPTWAAASWIKKF